MAWTILTRFKDEVLSRLKEGIATKFALIFSLLVLVATGTVGFMVYRGAENALINASTNRLEQTAEVVKVRLSASTEAISKDVRFLAATPPVRGIVRAHLEGVRSNQTYIDPKTYIDDQEWLDQLADVFTVFLENRPSYVRASLIMLARTGHELVRVEKTNHRVHRLPQSKLERDVEPPYLRKVVGLPSGAVYLSDVDLNGVENNGDQSDIPTVRAVTPIYAPNGKVYGLITIYVDVRYLLDALQSLVDPSLSLYLANEGGEFLMHPNMQGTFQDKFPQISPWMTPRVHNSLVRELKGETQPSKIAYLERLPFGQPPNRHSLMLGITSPYETILARVSEVRTRSLFITLLFCLAGIVFALGFSGYLTQPLRQITQALSQFGRNGQTTQEPIHLPTHRQDEIGMLARTFDSMTQQIRHQMHELTDKEHRQRIILETSAEGIIVVDADGTVETFNRTAERLFDYEASEIQGSSIEMLLPAAPSSSEETRLPASLPPWKLTGSGREITGQRKNGTFVPLSLAVSAFELSGEQKYALFLQDISERKRYEQALQQAKEQAEEIARLKSAFLANMSHEIRTPLTTVIGYASVLAREASEKHRRFAQLIKSNSKRLMDTLNSVLSLARMEASGVEMQLDLLNVAEEAREVAKLFRPLAEKENLSLTFTATADTEDTQAFLNRGALSSILQNLIGNAIKFTEEGEVAVRVEVDAHLVHVEVEDTGIGIDPDFIPHLFDKFVQESTGVNRSYEGSGLGLAITKRLVESMDGRITVESEKGEGTIFTVSVPRAKVNDTDEVVVTSRADVGSALPDLPRTEILFVEDNPSTGSMVKDLLHDACDLTLASNAEEALHKAQEHQYDLVLLDINLGGGPSGVEVLHQLRALPAYQNAPIAALTAYALPGDRDRFLKMGFNAYLSKPFAPEDLYQLITHLLEPAQ